MLSLIVVNEPHPLKKYQVNSLSLLHAPSAKDLLKNINAQ